jgi:hypothetical protein
MSVGWLYFVNTAGSALAALATVVIMLGALGEIGSVRLAASLNFLVAAFVMMQYLRTRAN